MNIVFPVTHQVHPGSIPKRNECVPPPKNMYKHVHNSQKLDTCPNVPEWQPEILHHCGVPELL